MTIASGYWNVDPSLKNLGGGGDKSNNFEPFYLWMQYKLYQLSTVFQIPDDYAGYPLNSFCIPAHYSEDLERILLPCGLILDRVERLAKDIAMYYQDQSFSAFCVLKGGYKFFADLLDRVRQYNRFAGHSSVPFSTEFIRIKSYVVSS